MKENAESKRPIKWGVLKKRIVKHHLPLLIISSAFVIAMYQGLESDDAIWKISMATAYAALVLLAATLVTGPWKVVRNRPNPVSDDLTRDIGIWAAITGLVHTAFGLQVHMRGRMWLLFFSEDRAFPFFRADLFGTANDSGLAAAAILVMLLAISNNRSLRALGPAAWKRMQRWNYGLFLLIILHSLCYMELEHRAGSYIVVFASVVLVVLSMQLVGFVHRRRRQE